jgi:hypothetical protein
MWIMCQYLFSAMLRPAAPALLANTGTCWSRYVGILLHPGRSLSVAKIEKKNIVYFNIYSAK